MRILITGHKGFIGRKLAEAYKGHEIHTLDAGKDFHKWMTRELPAALHPQDLMESSSSLPLDVIFHVGALNNAQYQESDIYLWNSFATFLIAYEMANKPSLKDCHLVYFSSRCGKHARDLGYHEGGASPYGFSKMFAEDYIRQWLPDRAAILQPQNVWGDESDLYTRRSSSVPYLLATHRLEYLFHNLSRDFVHVDDVIDAAVACATGLVGTFEVGTGKCTTAQELAAAIEWNDYEWRTPEKGRFLLPEGTAASPEKWVPYWEPKIEVVPAMQELERKIHA